MKIAIQPTAPDCPKFWQSLSRQCPTLYSALRKHGEAELTESRWNYVQSLPGFDEGPPVALVATSTRVILDLPPALADAIAATAQERGATFKGQCRALLGAAIADLPAIAHSVARAISIDGKPTEQDYKRAYAALACAESLPPR